MLFCGVIAIEKRLEIFENWYEKHSKYIAWIWLFNLVLTWILLSIGQMLFAQVSFISGLILVGMENSIGWKHSVHRWLKLCLVYNMFFSMILAYVLQRYIEHSVFTLLFVLMYMFVWIVFSLIADSKVALLVNEIVSGLIATIFTIGTYLVSMTLKGLPTSADMIEIFQTEQKAEIILHETDSIVWRYVDRVAMESLEDGFVVLLPVIGVSLICIVVLRLKEYWKEKYNVVQHIAE